MRLLRPMAIIAAFLIIAFSSPPSLLSQTAPKPYHPKRPAPRQSHLKRPPRADALAAVISDLLRLDPLAPGSPDEKDSEKRATKFGRYDSKNFIFTPLLEFSELELSSDDIWVDATSGKIWFAYKGHLLRLPLPAQMN